MLNHWGGDLVRSDEKIVNSHYEKHKKYNKNFKPVQAMLISRPLFFNKKKPVILWNAPGVIDTNTRFIKKHIESLVYLSVRDVASKNKLKKFDVRSINIVPDTALLIKDTIENNDLDSNDTINNKLENMLNKSDGKKIIGFHCNKWFLDRNIHLKYIADNLTEISSQYDCKITLIPTGICHGDLELLRDINNIARNKFILSDVLLKPLEIAMIISKCDYLIASSLHANITASSFKIPHLAINTICWPKTTGFLKNISRSNMLNNWSDLKNQTEILISEKEYSSSDAVDNGKAIIKDHFDIMADRILTSI